MSVVEKRIGADSIVTQDSEGDRNDCCSTTEDGNAVCIVAQNIKANSCECDSSTLSCGCDSAITRQTDVIQVIKLLPSQPRHTQNTSITENKSVWQKIRSGVMFLVACIASPCCTPLFVPLVSALFAGTPAAIWLGQNLGWVYGGLTLLSVVSLVLGLRWMGKNGSRRAV